MIIPEINPHHLDVIPAQRKKRGWDKGLIVVKSNCSIQSYMAPVYALIKAGYRIQKIILTTLQALSGAGYPGPAAIDLVDNIVPYIGGEEEKSEIEILDPNKEMTEEEKKKSQEEADKLIDELISTDFEEDGENWKEEISR